MQLLIGCLDEWNPHVDHPNLSVHVDPDCPIIRLLRRIVEGRLPEDVLIRLVASKRSLREAFEFWQQIFRQ